MQLNQVTKYTNRAILNKQKIEKYWNLNILGELLIYRFINQMCDFISNQILIVFRNISNSRYMNAFL